MTNEYLTIPLGSNQTFPLFPLADSTCQMTRQVYQYSENEMECDFYLNKIKPFCYMLIYNCSDEEKVFKGNHSVSFRPTEASMPWRREPLPLISHSKNNPHEQEHREGQQHPTTHNSQKKEIKHDSIRRIRKPHLGGWTEHILEIGLVSIVVLTLLLIFVRICWAERDLLKYVISRS